MSSEQPPPVGGASTGGSPLPQPLAAGEVQAQRASSPRPPLPSSSGKGTPAPPGASPAPPGAGSVQIPAPGAMPRGLGAFPRIGLVSQPDIEVLPVAPALGAAESPKPEPLSFRDSSAPTIEVHVPPPVNEAGPDLARRRSRRTVKIPDDAVPHVSPAPRPAPAADANVIRPMRIIQVASDLPAVRPGALADIAIAAPSKHAPLVVPAPEPAAPAPAVQPVRAFDATPTPVATATEPAAPAAAAPTPPPAAPSPAPPELSSAPVAAGPGGAADDELEEIEPEPPSQPSSDVAAARATAVTVVDDAGFEAEEIEVEPDRASDPDPVPAVPVRSPPPRKPPPPPPPRTSGPAPALGAQAATPTPPPTAAAQAVTPQAPPAAAAAPPAAAAQGAAAAAPVAAEPPPAKRQKPWWEDLFGDDFIRTMGRIGPSVIKKEVDFVEASLGLEKGAVILDLACGAGQHAVELASRGYAVVGYDLSLAMLARAADEAQERNQKLNFLQGDMREMAFEATFDGVYCWATSFGYFDEERNADVLLRVHRALREGGLLLLDVINKDYVAPRQPSMVWFEGEGCVCMDEMSVDFFTSRLKVKRTAMFDDGRSRELDYSIRLYALHELGKLLHECGFKVVEVTGHLAHPGTFFGSESPRVLVLAERA